MDHSLRAFRNPASVALIGASPDMRKWGNWFVPGLLAGRHRREVVLVNERGANISGVASVRRIADSPVPPELAVICVPPAAVPRAVDEALAVGATGLLVITAGIDHMVGHGTESLLATTARAAGARLIGPNCVGLLDAANELRVLWAEPSAGSMAIVSQSGQIGLEFASAATACGLGVSRFVSLGNQVDVCAVDVLEDLIDDELTRVVALYLESFGDGRDLVRAISRLHDAGTPTVLLTVGGSSASSAAARSHTGSLTSSMDVVDAACRAAGAIRATTPLQVVDAARVLASACRPRGRRIAIVGDSGGQGAVAADLAAAVGMEVPPFPDSTQTDLAAMLDYNASVVNPVDLGGAGTLDYGHYGRTVETAITSGVVDLVVLTGYFGGYSLDYPDTAADEIAVANAMCTASTAAGVPVFVHSQAATSATLEALAAGGITTHRSIDRAISAAGSAVAGALSKPRSLSLGTVRPAGALAGAFEPRQLLADAGIPFARSIAAHDRSEARDAASSLHPPFVLKADWVEHKTEVGGVVLGLSCVDDVLVVFDEMRARLGVGRYLVEEMDTRSSVVEMLVCLRRDPAFGDVIVVGAGGALAELHRDTTQELAPVDAVLAEVMLRRLRCWPLLEGWRGAPRSDVDALIELIVALSGMGLDGLCVDEIEINPVRVSPSGVLAVDVLVVAT